MCYLCEIPRGTFEMQYINWLSIRLRYFNNNYTFYIINSLFYNQKINKTNIIVFLYNKYIHLLIKTIK